MSELPWFKFYHEAIRDEKLVLAAARTHQTFIEILGVWTIMLSLAAKSPTRGILMLSDQTQYYENDLAALCHLEIENIDLIVRAFIQLNMLELDQDTQVLRIKNWDKRQAIPEEKELSPGALRTRRWREKLQEKTSQNVTENITERYSDASLSISSSISNSLINDSLTEKNIFSIRDAERAYIQVTQFSSVPMSMMPYLENILDMLQHYGWDETIIRLTAAKDNWVSHKNKSNGANWKLTNPAWIDYAITGETAGGPPKLSDIERVNAEINQLAKRNQ